MSARWVVLFAAPVLLAQSDAPNEARAYDRLQGRWSRAIAPTFIRFANPDLKDKFLDYGCATGAAAKSSATLFPDAEVVGVDATETFLPWARLQASRSKVRFQAADLVRLPFPDGEFDATFSLQAISQLPDPERAAREMSRVTKPVGVVAAAVWDYGLNMQPLQLFWNAAMAVDPDLSPADGTNTPFSKKGQLEKLWTTAGFRDVVEQSIEVEVNYRDFDDYWAPFVDDHGPAGLWLAAQPPERRNRVREVLRTRVLGTRADGPFVLRVRAWAVKGIVRHP